MEPQLLTADPALEAAPAAARAYRALERLIVTLELPPGSVATEGALIEKVGLGRTPVREAIQRLAWEGLVEVRPRAGLAIAPLHPADWLRVLDARNGVEIVLARSAARFATQQTADQFHAAALAMQKAVIAGNVIAFLEADKALDDALSAAADNPFAARLAAPLQTHSRRFWFRYQADTGVAAAAERHVALIRAILSGDAVEAGEEAARLMALLRRYAEAVATQ
ncbi:GntR family transcriptional regulator [Mesorhizobium sp. BAC0120]|uniref:GntR family transcriptional regulator n=1 Tax=Mesorhizobium sp. BAC0120 TaxID=3090670 RepID=UPI00298C872F|nr:GntR family transcriptional regulator [Mesorhizobium sp. BAC0120]MDW6021770.1 GntR family transcriptional regulator [Mesorhizobium sp. BAC0120]